MDYDERRYNISLIIFTIIRLITVLAFTIIEIKCIKNFDNKSIFPILIVVKGIIVFVSFFVWGIIGRIHGYIIAFIEQCDYYEDEEEGEDEDE